MFVGKLGTFVALGVRGEEWLRIVVLIWVSFMLKWVKRIGSVEVCYDTRNGHMA